MTRLRQRIIFWGILAGLIVFTWLGSLFLPCAPCKEEAFEVVPDADSQTVQWSRSDRLIQAEQRGVAINVADRWKGSKVLLSQKESPSSDDRNYRLRRIVEHSAMRYPILVEEIIRLSSESETVEARTVISEKAAGHFLLTPKEEISEESLRKAIADQGLILGERVSNAGPYRIFVPESQLSVETIAAVVADFNSGAYSNIVAHADYDFVRRVALAPNDSLYRSGDQWGLENNGSRTGSIKGTDIGASEGWETRTDASSVVVAIVDTGVRYTHEDLEANIWVNSDEVPGNGIDDDNNGYVDDVHGINALFSSKLAIGGDPMDDNGHGTHVAGTIGAVGNNHIGIAGVAWNIQLMPLKFLGSDGSGLDSDAIKCIDYAISEGADIINNSWGGEGVNKALADAVERADAAGIIFVVAAGNGGDNIDIDAFTPAGIELPNVVTVANHDDGGELHLTSNYGVEKVDIAAPGTRIHSVTNRSDSSYGVKTGTSMAAPHVSGVLALLRAEYPNEYYLKLIERVLQGGVADSQYETRVRTSSRLNLAGSIAVKDFLPASPSNSMVTSSSGFATLSWENEWNEPIKGFRIEKRIDDGDWNIAGFVRPEGRRFIDPVQLYTSNTSYRLISVNGYGDSLPSQNRALNTIVESRESVDIQLPLGDANIGFGSDIDASDSVMVIGAPLDDDAGDESGSVYLYERREGSGWQYRQKLIGADGESYDRFGHSVSMSGSVLAVGAYNEDNAEVDAGAVYVFERRGNGDWSQSAKIVPADAAAHDKFGFCVDVYEDTLVASARDDDDSGQNAGSVYVYKRESNGDWIGVSKLLPPSNSSMEYFGWSLSIQGDRIIVGAKGDDTVGVGAGSVYVYLKNGDIWMLEQKIVPPGLANYDAFGTSVDFDGESIVIGTPNDDERELDSGSVSLYRYSESKWEKAHVFYSDEPQRGGRFGADVAVLGKRVAAIGQADDGGEALGQFFEERLPNEWISGRELLGSDSAILRGLSVDLSKGVVSAGNPSERKVQSIYDISDSPSELRVVDISHRGVSLSWTETGVDSEIVVIERREKGEKGWRVIAKKNWGDSRYVDSSATGGRRWEYRIRTLSGGFSAPSNVVSTALLPTGRLVNLSVRGFIGEGEQVLVSGFTAVGSEDLKVALRARGPSLLEQSVTNPILDPRMTVFSSGGRSIGQNDDWFPDYSIAEMEDLERETGASPIALYASESVYIATISTGVYTTVVRDVDGIRGPGLAEIYEIPVDHAYNREAALVNLSARGFVGSGANVLIGGFVVAENAPVRVLIRGIGPGLLDQGVVDVVEAPRITLYDTEGAPIATNQDWGLGGQIAEIRELSNLLGAFELDLGSFDSGLVVTLPPGLYTCVLDTESDENGVGLLEIYLAP